MRLLRRAWAFLLRDLRQQLAYRTAFVLQIVAIVVTVLSNYFLGRFVDGAGALPEYRDKGGYFAFSLTGTALLGFVSVGLRGFSDAIRQAQLSGTLEAVFTTPVRSAEVVLWGSLWAFVYEALNVLVFLGAGLLLGVPLGNANWLSVVVVATASVAAIVPLGVFGAAFILVFQKGDPIGYLVGALSMLFSGVFYPTQVLPPPLRSAAELLPLTHCLQAFRGAVFEGASVGALSGPLLKLCAFAAILGPLAFFAFARAVDWAKRQALLAQY